MAERKAHAVDAFVRKPDAAFPVVLIYGPDRGLVSERAERLARASGIAMDDPFAIVRMSADDAAADPSSVADEAHAVSMFGGRRLVWITGSTQKQLVNAIKPVLDTPPDDALVIIEAGDLRKTAPLRKLVERATHGVALPCYQDTAAALAAMIDEELTQARLTMDRPARALLVSLLGNDRLVSRGEVQKLMLYCIGRDSVSEDDVVMNVGDGATVSTDRVVDAAALGNNATLDGELARLLDQETGTFSVLSACQRHFQTLHDLRCQMDASNQSPSGIMARARSIPYPRKAATERALSVWNRAALTRTLERIDRVVLESRANPDLAGELTATALLAIALEARRLSR